MNKEFYVESQLKSAFITKTLLENDASESLRIFTSSFELLSFGDAIDLYLTLPNNYLFILYFDDIRSKLKDVLEMYTFKLNAIENDYLLDEVYATQNNVIELINSLNIEKTEEESKEVEETILLCRGIESEAKLDKKNFLRVCYINDEAVIQYIVGAASDIKFNDSLYPIILLSMYYYFNQIVFVYNESKTNERLKSLLNYEYKLSPEAKGYIEYMKKQVSNSFSESLEMDYNSFIDEILVEDEKTKEERNKMSKLCTIHDFETNKQRILKNRQLKGE